MASSDANGDGFAEALALVLIDVQRRILAEHHRSWPKRLELPASPQFLAPPQPSRPPAVPAVPAGPAGPAAELPEHIVGFDFRDKHCPTSDLPPGAVPELSFGPAGSDQCGSAIRLIAPSSASSKADEDGRVRPQPRLALEIPESKASSGPGEPHGVSFGSSTQVSFCEETISEPDREFNLLEALEVCFVSAVNTRGVFPGGSRDAFRLNVSTLLKLQHSLHTTSSLHTDSCFYACLQRMVMSPGSSFQLVWELAALVFVFFDCAWLTLRLFDPPEFYVVFILGWVSRVFWAVNMPFSCFCGYIDESGSEVVDPICVVKRYLRSWFLIDVLVVLLDLGELALQRGGGLWIRIFRVTRVVRLCRARKSFLKLEERVRSEALMMSGTLLRVLGVMTALSHLIAGLWFYIGTGGSGSSTGWVEHYGMRPDESGLLQRYSFAFHFALSLFAGEHVIPPMNMDERWFVCGTFMFTFMMAVYMQSSITSAMTRITIVEQKRSRQLLTLSRYLSDNGISNDLALKVSRNATHALLSSERHAPENSVELLQMISDPLKSEIHFEIFSPMISIHPFFSCYNAENTTGVRKICHDCVSRNLFSSGDVLFVEHEVPATPQMLFVISGFLDYVRADSELERQEVTTSHWVSEAVLWTNWTHRGTLYASDCEVVCINASRFVNCVSQFPCSRVRVYAQEFLKALNAQDAEEISDLGSSSTSMLVEPISHAYPGKYTTYNQQLTRNTAISRGAARGLDSVLGRGSSSMLRSASSGLLGATTWRWSTMSDTITRRFKSSRVGPLSPSSASKPRRTTNVAQDVIAEDLEYVLPADHTRVVT